MSQAWIVAFAILASLTVALAIVVLGVIRRCIPVLIEAEAILKTGPVPGLPPGLTPGMPVSEFAVDDGDGGEFTRADLIGHRSVVLFIGPACSPCRLLMDEMRATGWLDLGCQMIAVLEESSRDAEFADSDWFRAIYPQVRAVSPAFGTSSTPHAFAVDERGVVVAASVPNTLRQLIHFAETAWQGGDSTRGVEPVEQRPVLTN